MTKQERSAHIIKELARDLYPGQLHGFVLYFNDLFITALLESKIDNKFKHGLKDPIK